MLCVSDMLAAPYHRWLIKHCTPESCPKVVSTSMTGRPLGSPEGAVQLYDVLAAGCLMQAINVLGDDGKLNALLLRPLLKGGQCQVASIGLAARHDSLLQ